MHLTIRQLKRRIAALRELVGAAEVETVAIAREMLRMDEHRAVELGEEWAELLSHAVNMTLAAEQLMEARRRPGFKADLCGFDRKP